MNSITKYSIIVILSVLSICAKSQVLPDSVRIYYWHNSDPWGWNSDQAIPASEILYVFSDYIKIQDSNDIKKLIPEIAESERDTSASCFLSHYSDSRFVVLLMYPAKTDTVSMPAINHFPIRYNTDFCFRDKDYYDFVIRTIVCKDKRFKRWYNAHYYDGSFHFFEKGL